MDIQSLQRGDFASMRPQLVKRYGRIVQEYRTTGWGIYDDTPWVGQLP